MNQGVAWLLLVVSGLLDAAWAISMKYAEGYTRPGWTILSLALFGALLFGEPVSFVRLGGIGLVVAGIIALKLASA